MKLLKVVEGKITEYGKWVTYAKDLRIEMVDHTVEKREGLFKTTIIPAKDPHIRVNIFGQYNRLLASLRFSADEWRNIVNQSKNEQVKLGVQDVVSIGKLHFFLEGGSCSAYKLSLIEPHVVVEINKKGHYWKWEFPLDEWQKKNRFSTFPVTIGIALSSTGEKIFLFMYKGVFYASEISMTNSQVRAVIENTQKTKQERLSKELERVNKREELERAKAHTEYHRKSRSPIPENVQIFVWNRDKGKCVKCGSSANLEFDHIVPLSKGGSNTARNVQLLCEKCNRSKGAKIG